MKRLIPPAVIGVIGAGTMGQGIAQACASSGFRVILYDLDEAVVSRARSGISDALAKQVEKGKLSSAERKQIESRITGTNALSDVVGDLIIEAIVEDLAVKQKLFGALEQINGGETILVSNTSSLSVTRIGEHLQYGHRFAGLHFFNPAPVMKLVEVVRSAATADDTIAELMDFCALLGKQAVRVHDSPGFIVNRVARPFYVEALRLLEEGACDEKGIDRLMRAAGFRMGPFELMDLIGVDTNLAVTKSIYQAFGEEPRFRPGTIQQAKVDAGQFGRKTGRGFYEYPKH